MQIVITSSHITKALELCFFELHKILANLSPAEILQSRPDIVSSKGVNTIYNNLIHGLLNCSLSSFESSQNPQSNFKKWWWDDSIKAAKARSLSLFNLWVAEGSPLDCQSFVNYRKAKSDYCNLVRNKKRNSQHEVSNKLFNSLKNCNSHAFWKVWKTSFPNKNKNNKLANLKFDSLDNKVDIANHLATAHQANCTPNSSIINDKLKNEYLASKQVESEIFLSPPAIISIPMIDNAIHKINNNTAPGHDSIHINHFKLAHPSVIVILKALFNIFLFIGEVPLAFGKGLVTPIPKFKGHKNQVNADDFRGITINVIASKIFEHCLASFLNCLDTSNRQFGFKKGLSCLHAINTVKNVIQHFTRLGSTVSLCFVDVKKAFDKINIWGLLSHLRNKHVNQDVLNVLENWFAISSACVKWDGVISDTVSLSAGVRQGGILSPLLFSSYVDLVLSDLEDSTLGCFIKGQCVNSFLYADDLLLISISVSDLQLLLNVCSNTFAFLDLHINMMKSCCLRFGNRHRSKCKEISLNNTNLAWVNESKYLGVTLKAGLKFSCNWHLTKRKAYSALNSILGSLGNNPPIDVTLSLFQSFCIPILTYGLAALPLLASDINSLSFVYNAIFRKLFKSNNNAIIDQCIYFCHFWPFWAL